MDYHRGAGIEVGSQFSFYIIVSGSSCLSLAAEIKEESFNLLYR